MIGELRQSVYVLLLLAMGSACGAPSGPAAAPVQSRAEEKAVRTVVPTTRPMLGTPWAPTPAGPPSVTAVPTENPSAIAASTPEPTPDDAAPSSPAPSRAQVVLGGSRWALRAVGGRRLTEGFAASLRFHDLDGRHEAAGTAGCNSYHASYVASGHGFRLVGDGLDTGDFACEDGRNLDRQERSYFRALRTATNLQVDADVPHLADRSGRPLLSFDLRRRPVIDPALAGERWRLQRIVGRRPIPGAHITLQFRDGDAGGMAVCNRYGGEYSAANNGLLRVPELASSRAGCSVPTGGAEQEREYIRVFSEAAAYRATATRLEIQNKRGDTTLVYAREASERAAQRALMGTRCRLVRLGTTEVGYVSRSVLTFDARTFRWSLHCSEVSGTYEVGAGDVRFPVVDRNQHSCPDGAVHDAQEALTAAYLAMSEAYEMSGDDLRLETAGGVPLLFRQLRE